MTPPDVTAADPDAPLARVAELFVYPIKSLAGVRLSEAAVGDLGVDGDRRWMLVGDDGVFLTQRRLPRMALLRVAPAPDGGVRVTAPTGDTLTVAPPSPTAPRRRVVIWHDTVDAATYPVPVDAWLSAAVGLPCHLVYMPDDVRRRVEPAHAGPDDRAPFSDAYPLTLVARESLADLNERLIARGVDAVGVDRFRPNVVVEGAGRAFAEDGWGALRVGSLSLRLAKPCARCVLTTVDPATAEPSPRGEPLRTLATYRTRDGKVWFAQNALVRAGGRVRVGDAVRAE